MLQGLRTMFYKPLDFGNFIAMVLPPPRIFKVCLAFPSHASTEAILKLSP